MRLRFGIILAGLLVCGLLVCGLQGCKLAGLERPPYPADPLLLSKKPDPDHKETSQRTLLAALEPATPTFPAAAFASRHRLSLQEPASAKSLPAQPISLPGGKVTLIPAIRARVGETHGQAADLSWLQGTLDKHHEGYFQLRYAEAAAADPWGGKVRLEDDARLDQYQDGDLVRVEGSIVPGSADQPADFERCPRYRVRTVQVLRFKS